MPAGAESGRERDRRGPGRGLQQPQPPREPGKGQQRPCRVGGGIDVPGVVARVEVVPLVVPGGPYTQHAREPRPPARGIGDVAAPVFGQQLRGLLEFGVDVLVRHQGEGAGQQTGSDLPARLPAVPRPR